MGCNTSSEAKPGKEVKSEQNHKEPESDKKAPAKENEAATKIQAVFRGHQTRKSMSMKASSQGSQGNAQKKAPEPEPTRAELEAEFRADDKELCNAATKIQASFRGHQSRKQVEQEKEALDKDKPYGYHNNENRMMRPRIRFHNPGFKRPLTFFDDPPPLRVRYITKHIHEHPMVPSPVEHLHYEHPYTNVFESKVVWPARKSQKVKNISYHRRMNEQEEMTPLEPIEQPFAEEQNGMKAEELSKLDVLKKDVNCATCLLQEILDPNGMGLDQIKDPASDPDQTEGNKLVNKDEFDQGSNVETENTEVITEKPESDNFSEQPDGVEEEQHDERPVSNRNDEEDVSIPEKSRPPFPDDSDVNDHGDVNVEAESETTLIPNNPESGLEGFPNENSQSKNFEIRPKGPEPSINNYFTYDKNGHFDVDVSGTKSNKPKSVFESYEVSHENPDIGDDISHVHLKDSANIEFQEVRPSKILKFKIHDAVSPLEVHMPFHYKYVKMLTPSISPTHINVLLQCVNVARKGNARRLKACHRNVWRKITNKNRVILNMPSHHCVETSKDIHKPNVKIPNDLMVLKTNTRPVSVKTNEPSWLSIFGSDDESRHVNSNNREELLRKLENWALSRGNKNVKRELNQVEEIFGVSD